MWEGTLPVRGWVIGSMLSRSHVPHLCIFDRGGQCISGGGAAGRRLRARHWHGRAGGPGALGTAPQRYQLPHLYDSMLGFFYETRLPGPQNLADSLDVLHKLAAGMDVNVRFNSIHGFEATQVGRGERRPRNGHGLSSTGGREARGPLGLGTSLAPQRTEPVTARCLPGRCPIPASPCGLRSLQLC